MLTVWSCCMAYFFGFFGISFVDKDEDSSRASTRRVECSTSRAGATAVSLLKAVLARSETAVRFTGAVAAVTELRSLLTVGCDALHFSGHGLPRSLSFN
ncbi:hypothetical protein JL721_13031 [Aureococcus anophagefferens]|nr:hypothetical protein JL721_13031 [Aureococcus anophagefferens]